MLTPGTRLGPYEIVGPLGSGGMGEVYRARDPRLGRDVAVKVLPPGFSHEADRLLRFEQEARAAAALNHPNILAVHDIGRHPSTSSGQAPSTGSEQTPATTYIVTELLEGETLRERLTDEAIPVRKAVDWAVQIARGLAAAHDKGIVHRDLKPENIFITFDGRVKILDFGLAKLTEKDPAVTPATELMTTPNTDPGLVLGTVGYMAPEQVRGLSTDHRADVFAFGAVLYEMLAGRRAFRRDTSMDTMSAILKEDPPDLPVGDRHIPPGLARIVDRCLEKSPAARFQSTGDLAFALEALSSHSGAEPALTATIPAPKKPSRLPWALVAVLGVVSVAAAAFGVFTYFRRVSPDVQATRFFVSPPEGWSLPLQTAQGGAPAVGPLAVSPDGHRVAFVARNASGNTLIWTRALDTLAAQALAGTEEATSPFWSPDGRSIGFFAQGKLKKIEISGGPPIALCDAAPGISGAWGRDGVIVFSAAAGTPLQKVSAAGGTPSAATKPGEGETGHARPSFLPDGRHFVYRANTGGVQRAWAFATLIGSTERTRLMEIESTNVVYSQRHLLFLRENTLMAQPFDPERLALAGDAFPVAEQIQTFGLPPYGFFSASDAGVLVYQTGSAAATPQLTWLDRAGKSLATVGSPTAYGDLALSLDGKKAAVSLIDSAQRTEDIWLVDLERSGLPTRFTFDATRDVSPIWSPDGSRVVFMSNRRGGPTSTRFDLYQKASSGTGSDDVLLADNLNNFPTSWSPDGRFILYTPQNNQGFGDLWILPLSGDRKPFPFLQTRLNEGQGQFSPDGRWIAYVSNESGPFQVYVAPFQGPGGAPGGKWQVSTNGGAQPRWRRDGKEIFFVSPDNTLMAAQVSVRDLAFDVGAVKALFVIRPSGTPRNSYQVSADGQRFLVNMGPVQAGAPTPITVVVNWTAGLKK